MNRKYGNTLCKFLNAEIDAVYCLRDVYKDVFGLEIYPLVEEQEKWEGLSREELNHAWSKLFPGIEEQVKQINVFQDKLRKFCAPIAQNHELSLENHFQSRTGREILEFWTNKKNELVAHDDYLTERPKMLSPDDLARLVEAHIYYALVRFLMQPALRRPPGKKLLRICDYCGRFFVAKRLDRGNLCYRNSCRKKMIRQRVSQGRAEGRYF